MSMDPNRYEVSEPELLRGLRSFRRGSFLRDYPRFAAVSGTFDHYLGVLLAPPRSNSEAIVGPQSLRVPPFATLGFLHGRGPSNRPVKTLTLPSDNHDGSSRTVVGEQKPWCTRSLLHSHRGGP